MECLLVTFLVLNGVLGAESHTEMKPNDKSEVSSLTSSAKISNLLRDVLNQESLVRFSMTQRIQTLFMDALDNKNNSFILKRKLNDINTELQSIETKDQKMKEENAQLKQELNTVKETIKYDKNLMMQQSENRERNMSGIMVKLQSVETNNQVMKEENAMLKQELNTVKAAMKNDKNFIMQQIQNLTRTEISVIEEKMENENSKFKQELTNLKMTSSGNKRNIQMLNNMNETIRKHNDAVRLQFQVINGSLQEYGSQLLNISTQLSSVHLNVLHKSCMEILQSGPYVKGKDGVYSIYMDYHMKKVYCDMTTDGGGWTVIQKREDGSTDFYRNWTDYKKGFGDPSKNYWIGNDVIHHLTQQSQELRVDLLSFAGERAYAKYSKFTVGDETSKYKLTVTGYSGTAGDSLIRTHNGHKFTTRDQDNDASSSSNCAVQYHGAWWYTDCHHSNLNGQYTGSAMSGGKYPVWFHWKYKNVALKETKMMVRPKS